MSSFISKFGAVFFDFECCEFAKFRFGLQLFSHFWNVNIVFFTGQLVKPFNGLLTFFIFLACYLRSFLYKGMLLPSFIHWGKCSSFSFFLLLSRFFFFFLLLISLYLFASFLVNFFMCYETFSLTKFFVACFCFAAQFLWSLGFDIKLYIGVHNALMLSLALVFEAILAFVLAIKLLQHLPLPHGHINYLYHEVVLALVLAMKQY